MTIALLVLILLIVTVTSAYSIRALRIIGTKISHNQSEQRLFAKQVAAAQKSAHQDSAILLAKLNNLNLTLPGMREKDFSYILSLTSHPARFDALALALPLLKNQVLQPKEVVLNIARDDINQLPQSIRDAGAAGEIRINECSDLGPGKKLIPTAKLHPELPIIVVDDDLLLAPDLTLQLMVEHHLYPGSIIAARVHRVTFGEDGSLEPFTAWEKATDSLTGPSLELLPTSGAGTLFPAGALHRDAFDEARYIELAFHTDDLWWYIHARRNQTMVRRLPGFRPLEFIPETQEVGLWQTGNKERNDINLAKLIKEYGVHRGN